MTTCCFRKFYQLYVRARAIPPISRHVIWPEMEFSSQLYNELKNSYTLSKGINFKMTAESSSECRLDFVAGVVVRSKCSC